MIVEILPRVSRQHLSFLGLHYGVSLLRDPWSPSETASEDEFKERVRDLQTHFADASELTAADYLHLASVSVAIHGTGSIVWRLDAMLRNHRWQQLTPSDLLRTFEAGQWLVDLWRKGGEKVSLTLVGMMLGGHVFSVRVMQK